MNTYTIEFTTTMTRDIGLCNLNETILASTLEKAEQVVKARYEGVEIVDSLCHLTVIGGL